MTSDAFADVMPDGDPAVIPDAAAADALEQQLPVEPGDTVTPELPTDLPDDVDPADALEQQIPVVPAEGAPSVLPTSLPDDVNPADALDQALPAGDLDDDR